jgi:hypothetical protein
LGLARRRAYTFLLVASPHVINVTLYEKSAITVTRDIVPVASINNDSFVLLVNPSFFDEVTMIDFGTAKILSHRRNIQRCVTLLATELTELERQYLHKQIAEERAELKRLQGTTSDAGVRRYRNRRHSS